MISEDDIFGNDRYEASNGIRKQSLNATAHIERKFNSEGYLNGITISKTEYLQQGFDYGYTHGVLMGLYVGSILGILQAGNNLTAVMSNKTEHNFIDWENTSEKELQEILGPKAIFNDSYYECSVKKLPKALFCENETRNTSGEDSNVEMFLRNQSLGNAKDHPLVKKWARVLEKEFGFSPF